jgi:hypothetical protein
MIESTISLEKYGCPENRNVLPVKHDYPTPRTREAWEEKHFVYFESRCQFDVSVLTRKVEDFCLPTLKGFNMESVSSPSDTYLCAWNILKMRGFEVVPSVRKVDKDVVATTNLSADNITSVYDQKIDALEVRDTFPMDGEFINIPIEEIQKEANSLVNLANKSGVELMSDGPFHIVVRSDGSWYLMLLDIGKVRIYAEPKNFPKSSAKDNGFYVNRAIRAFARIQQNIKSVRNAWGLS